MDSNLAAAQRIRASAAGTPTAWTDHLINLGAAIVVALILGISAGVWQSRD